MSQAAQLEQVPPHDAEAEACALGAMLIAPEAAQVAIAELLPADFYLAQHRALFVALSNTFAARHTTDEVVVLAELVAEGKLALVGGRDALGELIRRTPSAVNIESYCYIVRQQAAMRAAQEGAGRLLRAVADHTTDGALLDIAERTVARIRERHPDAGTSRRAVEIVNAATMLERYKTMRPVLIHNFLRRTETLNIIAPPKSRKSFLMARLALAIALGGYWLGQQCEQGRVLVIDNELHEETLACRIRTLAHALALRDADWMPRVDFMSLRGRLKDLMALERDLTCLPRGQYQLIIFDALYRFYPRGFDENDNAAMGMLYNQLDYYASITDAANVIVHHSTKGSQSWKDVTSVGSGGQAQSRAADSHVIMREHKEEDALIVELRPRTFGPLAPFVVKWNYPEWEIAPDLDPTEYAEPTRKGKAPGTAGIAAYAWTPERFTTELATGWVVKEELILRAGKAGVTQRMADTLLRAAMGAGLIIKRPQGPRLPFLYGAAKPLATAPQERPMAQKPLFGPEPELEPDA